MVRKTLKENKESYIVPDEGNDQRMRRNSENEYEELNWDSSNEERIKRNYEENVADESQDRAAIWDFQTPFKGYFIIIKIYSILIFYFSEWVKCSISWDHSNPHTLSNHLNLQHPPLNAVMFLRKSASKYQRHLARR